MIRSDDLTQVLGIETRRQRRRADEINEHDGQLSTLGDGLRGAGLNCDLIGARVGMACRRPQLHYRFEESLAMTEQHTELLEVGIGQLGQDFRVDRVVAKCLLVLLEPETSQPSGNVHTSSPEAEFGPSAAILTQMPGKCSRPGFSVEAEGPSKSWGLEEPASLPLR